MDTVNERTSLLMEQQHPGKLNNRRLYDDLNAGERLTGQQHCHSSAGNGIRGEREKGRARLQLYVASSICLLFIVGEVVGGYLAHSLAILTDAAHLLTDFASMLLSLFSLWMSSRPATKTMNFGWHRAEILGALLSVLSIWVVTGILVYLAVQRVMSQDFQINGGVMLITSGCAVAVNIIMGITLHQSSHIHGHSHGSSSPPHSQRPQQNASVRAAFVHVIGDLLQSLGVLVASYVIYFKPECKLIDPICTFLFSFLVLGTTLTILRDVLTVLMEGTPRGLDFTQVKQTLLSVKGVRSLHSLHIWALSVNQPVLSVHIAIKDGVDGQAVMKEASRVLQEQFDFHTITIQIEDYSEDMQNCHQCQDPQD
ncbi:zinc transporter 2-like [Megalops cyprinoides]|uniref:zinc transporter 2-like n=1 Tax=Megalops cyprinoides TaxID=118141 RepID=UPI001864A33E|nr:zinc transporter 2-like [Megalops cyprinoides]